jgi:hypothetical protein
MQLTTMQYGLVLGLLVLLLLLLVSVSVRRRKERAAGADAAEEVRDEPAPVAEAEVADAEVSAEVLPEVAIEVVPEVAIEDRPEGEAQVELEQPRRRRGLRRRRREPVGAAPETEDSPPAPDGIETDLDAETADQVELRALREQLRALEQVVQAQAGEHPTAALARVEASADEQSATYLRQVSFVVRGLAEHTREDENPHRTLARVAAAVERLGVPNEMERPILPLTSEPPALQRLDPSRNPSHRRETPELQGPAAGHQVSSAGVVEDVFSGLDLPTPGYAAQPVAAAAAPVTHVPPGGVAPVATPVAAPYAEAVAAPYAEQVADPTDVPTDRIDLGETDSTGMTDGGIPAFEEAEVVLPVPPPAAPQPVGRRSRRRRKSN